MRARLKFLVLLTMTVALVSPAARPAVELNPAAGYFAWGEFPKGFLSVYGQPQRTRAKISDILIAYCPNHVPSPFTVPPGGFVVAPDMSSATLDADTPCGHLHAVWTATGPLLPGVIGLTRAATVISTLNYADGRGYIGLGWWPGVPVP